MIWRPSPSGAAGSRVSRARAIASASAPASMPHWATATGSLPSARRKIGAPEADRAGPGREEAETALRIGFPDELADDLDELLVALPTLDQRTAQRPLEIARPQERERLAVLERQQRRFDRVPATIGEHDDGGVAAGDGPQ